MNSATQKNWKLMLTSQNSLMAFRLQIVQGQITEHHGLGVWGHAESWLVGGEVRVMNNVFWSWGQFWGLFQTPSVWCHGKVVVGGRISFHLRAQELKQNLGQDVSFSPPEIWTLWPLVRSRLLSSAALGIADYWEGGGKGKKG